MDSEKLKKDFPIFSRKINGKAITYLDNAATTQRPASVIKAISEVSKLHNANPHRGIYTLAEEITEMYEQSREKVGKFINSSSSNEVIFTRNASESLNLVMYSYGRNFLKEGDEVIISIMEHHSNLVPWQSLQERGVKLKFIPITQEGKLDLEKYDEAFTHNTRLVAMTNASNSIGTINNAKELCKTAHDHNAVFVMDGAQSVPHFKVDVQSLDCDFLAFSGHKMLGPFGIGVLYGKEELLEEMPPFLYGGEMIRRVELDKTTFNELPAKFEAGTPNASGAVGLSAAIDYLNKVGMENIREHEVQLTDYAMKRMNEVEGITIYGVKKAEEKTGVVSFNIEGIHAHDVASIMDEDNICIRAGHHCTMPLMKTLNVPATARASIYLYNTKEDIDKLVEGIYKAKKMFKV